MMEMEEAEQQLTTLIDKSDDDNIVMEGSSVVYSEPPQDESCPPKVESPMEVIHEKVKKQIMKEGQGQKPSKYSTCFGIMGPRWKGKEAEAKALANPLSKIVVELKDSLIRSDSVGVLSDGSVLLEADAEQTDLLNRACFGVPIINSEKDKQWFQLSLEEAFYLCCLLRCIKIVGESDVNKSDEELWNHMTSKRENFPNLMKAYSHLRLKNWVVRSGSQYGVDYVAYRHHPALVHSDYAVLVLSSEDSSRNGRLRVWSDFHCTLRLCGSVAKTLLVLYIDNGGHKAVSPSCLKKIKVEERTISRWIPEHCRENETKDGNVIKK